MGGETGWVWCAAGKPARRKTPRVTSWNFVWNRLRRRGPAGTASPPKLVADCGGPKQPAKGVSAKPKKGASPNKKRPDEVKPKSPRQGNLTTSPKTSPRKPSMTQLANADEEPLRVHKTGLGFWRNGKGNINPYYVWYTDKEILFGKERNAPPTGETWPRDISQLEATKFCSFKAKFDVNGTIRTLEFEHGEKELFLGICDKRTEEPVAKPNGISKRKQIHSVLKAVFVAVLGASLVGATVSDAGCLRAMAGRRRLPHGVGGPPQLPSGGGTGLSGGGTGLSGGGTGLSGGGTGLAGLFSGGGTGLKGSNQPSRRTRNGRPGRNTRGATEPEFLR